MTWYIRYNGLVIQSHWWGTVIKICECCYHTGIVVVDTAAGPLRRMAVDIVCAVISKGVVLFEGRGSCLAAGTVCCGTIPLWRA